MDSILTSIKRMLGIDAECTDFDDELIPHINTVLMVLNQIGVGPDNVFSIISDQETWENFLGEDYENSLAAVKTYVHLKVKLVFDPPSNSTILSAMQSNADMLEWRLNVQSETLNREE
jgi:hypothetical protein